MAPANGQQAGPSPPSDLAHFARQPPSNGSGGQQQQGAGPGASLDRRRSNQGAAGQHRRRESQGETVSATDFSSLAGFAGPRRSGSFGIGSDGAGGAGPGKVSSPRLGMEGGEPPAGASNWSGEMSGTVANRVPDAPRMSSAMSTSSAPAPHPTPTTKRALDFPVLPVPHALPNQTVQTPTQVQSILSLPPALLLHLARTPDISQQQAIAERAHATPYLSAMALPPPSPNHLVQGFAHLAPLGQPVVAIKTIGDHPAIPLLLGQGFCPPAPGITIPFSTTPIAFAPIYSSVEDWSMKEARERIRARKAATTAPSTSTPSATRPPLNSAPSFTERDIETVAGQLKHWAISEEERGIAHQVGGAKEAAVLLASQLSARSRLVAAATQAVRTSDAMAASGSTDSAQGVSPAVVARARAVLDGGHSSPEVEQVMQSIDLTPYAEPFKVQLAALASPYYAQLHREALNRLLTAAEEGQSPSLTSSSGTFPTSQAPSDAFNQGIGGSARGAMNVRAAASAAIAANVLAANEMALEAGNTLAKMGVNVQQLMPERQPGGLPSLETRSHAIAVDQTAAVASVVPIDTSEPNQLPPQPPQSSLPPPPPPPSENPRPPAPAAPTPTPAAGASVVEREVKQLLQDGGAAARCTEERRDYFLAYAHTLYQTNPMNEHLLPVLHMLEKAHPDHLPTLLLMSCVYYSRGKLTSSLYFNEQLLKQDPQYVEAMSNIGTTLRAMGKWKEAEGWWWKAIKLRPTYWDATENLLGVLCNPGSNVPPHSPAEAEPAPSEPRFKEALALCEYVDAQVFRPEPATGNEADHTMAFRDPSAAIPRPRALPLSVPSSHVHRLQNLFYAKGNLKLALRDTVSAMDEFSKAIEIALSLPAWVKDRAVAENVSYPIEGATLRDLVVVTTIIGTILSTYARFGNQPNNTTVAEALRLGVENSNNTLRFNGLFAKVQAAGAGAVATLFGGPFLPTVLLQPEDLNRILPLVFPDMGGMLPCMLETNLVGEDQVAAHRHSVQLASQTTSTMLLTIAKIFQDFMASPGAVKAGSTLGGIPISPAVLLPLYYVALALHPSPSTCNNLGILLSTINQTTLIADQPGGPPLVVNGQQLALKYYRAGLALDPKHPHLYTNLGSLLKDMGQLAQAVQMYRMAVEYNPTFDVALANLANAIKDTGHIQESIPFYRRAVAANPEFPEAICGLVNALGGVCDWIGRGGVNEAWVVDNQGGISPCPLAPPGEITRFGYMGEISKLVAKQLDDGHMYGSGAVGGAGDVAHWLGIVSQAIYNLTPREIGSVADTWLFRFESLISRENSAFVNEGGFIIRLIERLMRRVQRRWYLTTFGNVLTAPTPLPRITASQSDVVTYRRPLIPAFLSAPPVPTVLPFHVFTYPVSARETRLISHRTGLRISHNTLTQPWLPLNVYPPPPPPSGGKLNIGYVSSDIGNHPLSHLMQSVFGFHDLANFNVFCYATSPSDGSPYRVKIEREAQHFVDVSALGTQAIVDRIVADGIHILINLSGYTKGARNEVFACRPAPIQMSYMGFAGGLAAGWCDYFMVDPIVCPPVLVSGNQWRLRQGHTGQRPTSEGDGPTDFEGDPDPEGPSNSFVYTEKLIYLPHSYFVTDHRQAWFEDDLVPDAGLVPIANDGSPARAWAIEEDKRWKMRKALFPDLPDDTVIFACFNQLYKIDPFIFRIWLAILTKHPNSVLWLLRFPAPGEHHLKDVALRWAGADVARRVIFTDVSNKNEHIRRGRIPDLFLDTTECNAHTTACDALSQGTPVLTWPRYLHKMCSRVAASIVVATGFGDQMVVRSEAEYEARALALAGSLTYNMVPIRPGALPSDPDSRVQRRGRGELSDLRRNLFLTRGESPLFDTPRWVRNVEQGYIEAWRRWVNGTEFEDAGEWEDGDSAIKATGCIWIADPVDGVNINSRRAFFD